MMSYRHIDLDERYVIHKNIASGKSLRAGAALLGRSPSSISRELKRNCGEYRYRPKDADDKSKIRRKESRQRILDKSENLHESIYTWLYKEALSGGKRIPRDSGREKNPFSCFGLYEK